MTNQTIRAVIFDWAGTTVDYGCFAPTQVFIAGFKSFGVEITLEEARAPMGKHKRDHITEIIAMPRVASAWEAAHGQSPTDADVQAIYAAFTPKQIEVVGDFADLIPGTTEALAALREKGVKIGSCTGYTRSIMDALIPIAARNGYAPDVVVTADEVIAGRPAPWMALRVAEQLNIYPMASIVKVGDTVTDIEEGLNAGMWTIGLALTGNELGLTAAKVAAMDPAKLKQRIGPIYDKFYDAGAHFVVDSIAEVPAIVESINDLIQQGWTPTQK